MRHMSFALTKAPVLSRSKRITRRLGWKTLKPGTLLQPVEKSQGLKKGEKVRKIGGPIRVVSVRLELLYHITNEDVVLEGFPHLTPDEFVAMFCQHNKCSADSEVARIEFEYVIADADQSLKVEVQGRCLVISIGVETLAFAFRHSPNGDRIRRVGDDTYDESRLNIIDPDVFARDVQNALLREQEDGATPIGDVLDQACLNAFEDGSLGVALEDEA